MRDLTAVYLSFDRFPSPKGAATHIDQFIRALGKHLGEIHLLTLPPQVRELLAINGVDSALEEGIDFDTYSFWQAPGVQHFQIPAEGKHLFERTRSFRTHWWRWWKDHLNGCPADIVHFRSIFEGYPIARDKSRLARCIIYEVNGLPSIELKYHYPSVASDSELLKKLTQQEDKCLHAADHIVTVSETNKTHIAGRGVQKDRIHVIPNGVDLEIFDAPPEGRTQGILNREVSLLYAGGITSWQGVQVAIEALELLRRDYPATLNIVGPSKPKQRKEIERRIWKLGLSKFVHMKPAVSKQELVRLHHQADIVLAPLTACDRNIEQGCCPLKLLEALACQAIVVASDIPVVTELVQHGEHAILVRPGSAKALKDGCLHVIGNQAEMELMAHRGYLHARKLSWSVATDRLLSIYDQAMKSL